MTTTTDRPTTTPTTVREGGAARAPWLLIAKREIVVKLTDKSFLIGTLVTLLFIAGFMGWSAWDASKTSTYTVASTSADRTMADRIAADAPDLDEDVAVTVVPAASDDAARALVREGEADAWLHRGGDGWVLTTDDGPESTLMDVTSQVVRTASLDRAAGALGTTTAELLKGSEVSSQYLRGDADKADLAQGVAFAFAFLFYMASLLFGIQLANSVVEEKQSRVVEIIATSIPVRQLLFGKVIGNSVLAVLQMMLYAGVGLAGLAATPYASLVPSISGPIAWFLVFFVAGFVALASLWAVAGSLASRAEEVQSTSGPMTIVVLAVFFGAMFLDGTVRTVFSFVPPFSAVLMPTRVLEGGTAWWEPFVALALLVAAAWAVVVVAERLYRRSLLQTGGKLSMRQAWSAPE
ncbi:ABC transporter permease [Oryzobacter telluris]|uniref:ABC transporter permease n=1 Tax=Oryzobacter telluris TaxID=3149179 RepID=UPI00370D7AA7